MITTFAWNCPHCGQHHSAEQVDSERGPFVSLICNSCGSASDFSNLSDKDFEAWDDAIEKATL